MAVVSAEDLSISCLGAGAQHKPGVYLARSAVPAEDSHSNAAGVAALSPTAGASSSNTSSRSPAAAVRKAAAAASGKLSSPKGPAVTPLMYSGKPANLQGNAAVNATSAMNFQQQFEELQRQQEEAADAAVRAIMQGSGAMQSSAYELQDSSERAAAVTEASQGLGSSVKSHVYDVYGQPRVVQPPLPASHLKVSSVCV